MRQYYIYILTNKYKGTIYIGVTSDIIKRIWEHKNKTIKGFTSKYELDKLVYFEVHEDVRCAIQREKRLKGWPRKWKLDLIDQNNPEWNDLYPEILG